MDTRPYDIVVYGATGFTGQYVALEAVRTCPNKKIALAGRTKKKIEQVLDRINKEFGRDDAHQKVGIVIADNSNDESIKEMCRQSRMIINCVGPYRFYGEQVVRACAEIGTNYVDISGEPEFLQMAQIKYHDQAKEKGVHIVSACGFDSVPADLGIEALRQKFPGELTAVESYIHTYGAAKANYGTYLSLIHGVKNRGNLKSQQKQIFKEKLSYLGPRLKFRGPGFSQSENKWFIPFMGSDPSVVKRTQLFESQQHNRVPVQYAAYFCMQNFVSMLGFFLFGLIMFIFTKFDLGVQLLTQYPRIFSFGVFSKDGVTQEELDRTSFSLVFHGKGYSKTPESRETAGRPDQSLSIKFTGPEMGYIFTSISLVAAAVTILDDKLINTGGVLTTASALRETKFMERLCDRCVKVEVL